jgi:general secretion pathway protein G
MMTQNRFYRPAFSIQRSSSGFTLIELVIVVMIIGIIAAIVTPKMVNLTGTAKDSAAAQSLSVLRSAIDTYAAQHAGSFPGTDEATFKTALAPLIRGAFPKCPVGTAAALDSVNVVNAGTSLSGAGDASPAKGWKYDYTTGEIIINYTSTNGSGIRYDNL